MTEKMTLLDGFSTALTPELTWQHFDVIDSTNAYLLTGDEPTEQLISAERQTAGRGRRQQQWVDEGDSALFSLSTGFEKGTDISAWPIQVAVSLAQGLNALYAHFYPTSSAAPVVKIKWPNDLYIKNQGSWGKFGGILTESKIGKQCKVVAGIGLNLAPIHSASNKDYAIAFIDLPLAKKDLIAVLTNRLFADWQQFLQQPRLSVSDYCQLDYLRDQSLIATDLHSGEQQQGIGAGINAHGHLLLKQGEKTLALTAQQRIRFRHD